MKKDKKTNRTDYYLVFDFIIVFIAFWAQIILRILGESTLAIVDLIFYSMGVMHILYIIVEKNDPKRITKIVFGTVLMLSFLLVIGKIL